MPTSAPTPTKTTLLSPIGVSTDMDEAVVAGAAVAFLLLILLVAGIVYELRRQQRPAQPPAKPRRELEDDPESADPTGGGFDVFVNRAQVVDFAEPDVNDTVDRASINSSKKNHDGFDAAVDGLTAFAAGTQGQQEGETRQNPLYGVANIPAQPESDSEFGFGDETDTPRTRSPFGSQHALGPSSAAAKTSVPFSFELPAARRSSQLSGGGGSGGGYMDISKTPSFAAGFGSSLAAPGYRDISPAGSPTASPFGNEMNLFSSTENLLPGDSRGAPTMNIRDINPASSATGDQPRAAGGPRKMKVFDLEKM